MKKLLFFLLIICSLFLVGCKEKKQDIVINEVEEKEISFVDKIDETKDFVFLQYNENRIEVPYFNIKNEEMIALNNELLELMNVINSTDFSSENYYGLDISLNGKSISGVAALKCSYTIKDGILSVILLTNDYAGIGYHDYFVYNIDLRSGKLIYSSDILNILKIEPSEFLNAIKKAYSNLEVEYVNNDEYYEKTLTYIPQSVDEVTMYIDSNSKIHILGYVESFSLITGTIIRDIVIN